VGVEEEAVEGDMLGVEVEIEAVVVVEMKTLPAT